MKVLVIGANGKIGQMISKRLHESKEHELRAMVRKEEQQKKYEDMGYDTVLCSLEASVDEIADAMQGVDAVIFTAGSGGSTGPDMTLLIDLDGAVKSMEAAEKVGVKRYVMISALQAHNRENWSEKIKPYFVAKHYADRMLEHSKLDYTILRPGGLTDEAGDGKIQKAENLDRGTISRESVAIEAVKILTDQSSYGKGYDLLDA
ncbi:MAG: SDR family oxidoreductase [Cyclobacteriaceae bacterium]|nr:SDR family oxidoreductase [Cyclobacteriaceae bacterium]MCH8516298.1 SDR family oxidoreductase [Cyclobacteriaceae bacterium]